MSYPPSAAPDRPSARVREYDDPEYESMCADVARRLAVSCVHMEATDFEGLVRKICGRKFRWQQPSA